MIFGMIDTFATAPGACLEKEGSCADPDLKSANLSQAQPQVVVTERAQPGRRFIAAWAYDFLACFWLSIIVVGVLNCIFGNALLQHVPLLVVTMLIFLTRDFFFEGRGVGKNFLHLQVLDIKTGKPASLMQSIIRNFLIVGPYLLYQLAVLIDFLVPVSGGQFVVFAIKNIGFLWAALLLPIEGYFMHTGNGLRLADRLAGTAVVIQNSDFRNPLSLPRTFAARKSGI